QARGAALEAAALLLEAEQDREDVLLRDLLLEAAQPQGAPARLEPARDVHAVALGEVLAAQALHGHAQRDRLAGLHAPRRLDPAQERDPLAAARLYLGVHLRDVGRRALVELDQAEGAGGVGGRAEGDRVAQGPEERVDDA